MYKSRQAGYNSCRRCCRHRCDGGSCNRRGGIVHGAILCLCGILVLQFTVLFPLTLSWMSSRHNHNNDDATTNPRNYNHHHYRSAPWRQQRRKHGGIREDMSSSSSSLSSLSMMRHDATTTGGKRRQHEERQRHYVRAEISDGNHHHDGTFNGAPLYLRSKPLREMRSHVHCVGENYRNDAWKQRSCRFSTLCFNTTDKTYAVFESARDAQITKAFLDPRPFMHASSVLQRGQNTTRQSVSLGGLNLAWGSRGNGMSRLDWFPRVVSHPYGAAGDVNLTYYALPDNVVMIPFHSMNGKNPGHLVWDDFLPMYTLLRMFGLHRGALLLFRQVLNDGYDRGLWASCDVRDENARGCQKMITKFLPLMVGRDYPYRFTTNRDVQFRPNNNDINDGGVELVCANHGVAGMGSLTDHGVYKSHGWREADYESTHNHGRGGMLFDFRNFMMRNVGFPPDKDVLLRYDNDDRPPLPHRIVFSEKSSDIASRRVSFARHVQRLRDALDPERAVVENYVFKEMPLEEQVRVVHDASVFVTLCGGGAVTGMFLPAGAAVILVYLEDGGAEQNHRTYKPAMLDWDLFNAMSHLRVHWMPRGTRKTPLDEDAFVALVKHELEIIESGVFD